MILNFFGVFIYYLEYLYFLFGEISVHVLAHCLYFIFLVFFFFFFLSFSRAAPLVVYGDSQARGLIRAVATSLHHSHSNARASIHWARPGIEPAIGTSWFLVRFVSAAPWWELLWKCFLNINEVSHTTHDITLVLFSQTFLNERWGTAWMYSYCI